MSTELEKKQPAAVAQNDALSLDVFIQRALTDPNFDTNKVEVLERLLQVKREMQADQRRQMFFESLAKVQAEAPRIRQNGLMDRGTGKGQIPYAKREDIDAMLRPIYLREGFTVTWDAPMTDNRIQVIGRFTCHGHTETREWSCLPDSSGGKQNPQASGSTVSYGQRYISKMFWDVIEEGEDTNGAKTADVTAIDQDQADDIRTRLNDLTQNRPGVLLEKLCAKYGVSKPEDMRESQMEAVMKDVRLAEESEEEMSESTELAVVNAQNAVEIFTKGGLAGILDGVEKKVRAMSLDASTATGREEIRSVAYKVTRTKTALDAEAKRLTEGWRTATAQVNAERKKSQERLEALAEEVRAPLTAFENKEKNRIAAHESALAEMSGILEMLRANPNMEVSLLEDHQRDFAALHANRDWEEFGDRDRRIRREVSEALAERITSRRKFESDQAELKRLREEQAAREIREREERLKAEAAEQSRIEAERRAKEAADAEALRVIKAAQQEEARVKAEADRVRLEHERQQRDAEAARELAETRAREAEAARIEAERKAVADLKAAQEKAKRDAEAAVVKEKARVEAQRKAEADAQAKREADEKNIERIRKEIGEDLTKWSLHDLVAAIMDGKVRNVRVIY